MSIAKSNSLLFTFLSFIITISSALAGTDYLNVVDSTPAGCVNIQSYGAVANDSNDDTTAIQNAINYAQTQNYDVFVPAGRYLISSALVWKDGVSMLGSHNGISLIEGTGSWFESGDYVWGNSIDNINIEDIYFLNTGLHFDGGYYKDNYLIKNCVFLHTASFASDYSLHLGYITQGIIEDNIFMRQADSFGVATLTWKTRDCVFQRNIWGLDLQNLDWLATEYSGFSNWVDLIEKMKYLKSEIPLDYDQGQLKSGWYPQEDTRLKIQNNIFNGSPFCTQDRDHVIYAKRYTDFELISNYFRGWPPNAYGGVKLRNTDGWGYIVANNFDDTPLIQYTYDDTFPKSYQNALIYKNYFINKTNTTQSYLGCTYWEYLVDGLDWNIIYAENLFDNYPGEAWIDHSNGNPDGYTVYDSNVYVPTSNPVEIADTNKSHATGAPDSSLTSPYSSATVPYLDIPPFSKGWTYNLNSELFDFNLSQFDSISELQTAGWNFTEGESVYTVSMGGENTNSLKLAGGTIVRPEAVYDFTPSSKGTVSFSAYTASSYSIARVDLLDSDDNVLGSVFLNAPNTVGIECASGGLSSMAIPNSGTNNLLSSGAKGWSDFKIEWDGVVFNWYWTHHLEDGSINHQQFNNGAVFYTGSAPAKIRMRIDLYEVSYRHFGISNLFIGNTPEFDFDLPVYDTIPELETAGWSFTEGESVYTVAMNGQNRKSLKLNGGTSVRPEAVYVFEPSNQGDLSFSAFTASSYSIARVDIMDSSDVVLASVYLYTPTSVEIECASGGLAGTTIPNGGTNNLLSSGNKGWSDFRIEWDGASFNWYWTHRLENGSVNYQQSGTNAVFNTGGVPAKIRMRIDLYDQVYRHFGITDFTLWYSASEQ
jgi:hypothetical protein